MPKQTKAQAKPKPKPKATASTKAKTKAKSKAAPKKTGRPSSYTKAIGDEICERIAEGQSLRSICKDDHLPSMRSVMRWLDKDHGEGPEFRQQYSRAQDARADALFEECLEIADQAEGDVEIDDDGNVKVNHEAIARAKLRVDTRKWAAGRMNPKKYSERMTVTGDPDAPVVTETKVTVNFVRPKP